MFDAFVNVSQAFALPVLQIVHETLRHGSTDKAEPVASENSQDLTCVLNVEDRDSMMAISPDGEKHILFVSTGWISKHCKFPDLFLVS